MAAAFVGSLAGDTLYFEIGHRMGMAFLEQRPAWKKSVARVLGDVQRYERAVFAAIVTAGLAIWSWRRWRGRTANVDQGTLPV